MENNEFPSWRKKETECTFHSACFDLGPNCSQTLFHLIWLFLTEAACCFTVQLFIGFYEAQKGVYGIFLSDEAEIRKYSISLYTDLIFTSWRYSKIIYFTNNGEQEGEKVFYKTALFYCRLAKYIKLIYNKNLSFFLFFTQIALTC